MTNRLPIAYVNVDTIITEYSAAIEANDKLMARQESARADLNEKAKRFQADANEFNRKLENNAFLSRERAEQEAQRLQRKQSDLEALEQRLTNELLEEQQKLNLQLREDINAAIKEFNKDGRYHLILVTSAMQETVLYAVEGYDISIEVLEVLESLNKSGAEKK